MEQARWTTPAISRPVQLVSRKMIFLVHKWPLLCLNKMKERRAKICWTWFTISKHNTIFSPFLIVFWLSYLDYSLLRVLSLLEDNILYLSSFTNGWPLVNVKYLLNETKFFLISKLNILINCCKRRSYSLVLDISYSFLSFWSTSDIDLFSWII